MAPRNSPAPSRTDGTAPYNPWPALWSMMIGFFIILVDSTIVAVAIPAITRSFAASYNEVIWVNSSYLLAYAVPLLITGRLGDRFGPKLLYLWGLTLFTVSSLACGLAGTIEVLIIARAFQGLGGAMLSPQTMSVMIRTFPATQRGTAMGVWGATAGVATVVGPLLGGFVVDLGGWEWIFFINIPVGLIGLYLAWKHVPTLELTARRLDWLGVAISALGMFCLIFGIQEGEKLHWDYRALLLIGAGIILLLAFMRWQARTSRDQLVPLSLFDDRNFTLASLTIASVGCAVSTFAIPWMIYVQQGLGFTPTQAALLILPSGVVSGALSSSIGKLTNTRDPKPIAITGLSVTAASIAVSALITNPEISPYWMLLVSVFYGLGNSMMWGPLSMVATRNLDPALAGAGSSIYNTLRQVGAVIGSAAIAAVMSSQLTREPLPAAMSHSLWLPAAVLAFGVVIACFFAQTKTWSDNS